MEAYFIFLMISGVGNAALSQAPSKDLMLEVETKWWETQHLPFSPGEALNSICRLPSLDCELLTNTVFHSKT